MVSEKLGSQLRTKVDTKINEAGHQQLEVLLPDVLESETQALLTPVHIAQTDRTALLERETAEMMGKVGITITSSLLSSLKVSIKMEISGYVQSLVDSRRFDMDVLVNTV